MRIYEFQSRGKCTNCVLRLDAGRAHMGASMRSAQGSGRAVFQHPIGDGIQSLRGHGFLNATVFGGRARRAVLEEVVQAGNSVV